ncbi:MAG: acyl-CoA dehydratase activase, partial [Polyangia bacterium]|nr:acyl-CoA dehydratase activase [Polyangia bacterium]
METAAEARGDARRMQGDAPRLGLDIGSVNVKGVLLPGGGAPGENTWCRPVQGRPIEAVAQILEEAMSAGEDPEGLQVAVTGAGKSLLASTEGAEQVNEVVAVARAVGLGHPEVRTVIDIGGQFTKWILLANPEQGLSRTGAVEDFALNGLCAAGSGAFLEQQAGRLRLGLDELGRLAAGASRGATIAGRCSVFAKSDMIHLQQRGAPVEEIAYGLCLALARTFAATVLKGRRVEPPVALVGGGAANLGLVRAFGEVLGLGPGEIMVPADHLTAGARGAALGCSGSSPGAVEALYRHLRLTGEAAAGSAVFGGREARGELQPLAAPPGFDAPPSCETPPLSELGLDAGEVRGYLGVDVGSVSTNLVLLDESLRLVHGIYLPTRGAPVEVLNEALGMLESLFGGRLDVLGVGTTGSG